MQQPNTLLEGKYEILNKLREGGMGTIYLVRHRLLDQIRVIKVMRAHVTADPDLKRRFLEEAKTATRLNHRNICAIHDFALDEDGTAYLVMEFIDGVNLSELLALRGPPGLPLGLEIAHQALLALGYLHHKGVIHRDVAPDNLMLAHDEEERPLVKLIDLGIAKAADRATQKTATGVFLGKLRYASPELYGMLPEGEKLDGRSDIYSLGVVLYELLTGVRPFAGENPAEMLRGHLFTPPLPFSESDPGGKVPPELRAVILKALEKQREDRYASAEEFDREILSLKKRHTRPEDLGHTREILATIPRIELVTGKSVTPSAQDRLNRQFGVHTTPAPSAEHLTVAPTQPSRPERPGATPSASPKAAIPLPGRATTAPLEKPSRRPTAVLGIAAVLLALLAAFLLRRSGMPVAGTEKRPSIPDAAPTASAAGQVEAAPPTAPPRPPEPTAAPTAEPAPPTVPAAASSPPADLKLLAELDAARAGASRARQSAERTRGKELASETYLRARGKETEAQKLAARGKDAASRDAFDLAARLYAQAEVSARSAVAVASPPPAAAIVPSPSPRLESPRVAALVTPEREILPTVAAVAPGRSTPSEQEKIRETVHRYEKAQSSLDAELYVRIFPSVDRARIQQAFESFRSQSVEFEVRRIQIDPAGTRAEVYGYEKRIAVPRAGSEQRINGERVMHLEKRGELWVITQLN